MDASRRGLKPRNAKAYHSGGALARGVSTRVGTAPREEVLRAEGAEDIVGKHEGAATTAIASLTAPRQVREIVGASLVVWLAGIVGVGIAEMVDDDVEDDLDVPLVGLGGQTTKVLDGSKPGVNLGRVGH
jgi:hypothetical protein